MILNPSPLTPELIRARVEVDTLILNAQEAAALVSMTHAEIAAEPQRARTAAYCRQMIITRGGDPTLAITASGILNIAPPQVISVDTVGAGDAFAGAFTVASASGMPLEEAIYFANAAGALATQGRGAQTSTPGRDAILAIMGWGTAERSEDRRGEGGAHLLNSSPQLARISGVHCLVAFAKIFSSKFQTLSLTN